MTWEENLIRKKHALAHRKACEYAKSLGPYIAKEVAIEDYTCGAKFTAFPDFHSDWCDLKK